MREGVEVILKLNRERPRKVERMIETHQSDLDTALVRICVTGSREVSL